MNTSVIDNFVNDESFSREFYDYIKRGELKTSFNNIAAEGEPVDSFTSSLSEYDFHVPFIYDLYKKVNEIHTQHFHHTNSKIAKWHLNLHPTGYDGHAHADYDDADLPTYLYMPTINWHPRWGGEFLIYNHEDELIEGYTYRTDRMIIFNGRLPHRGNAARRVSTLLRTTIAFQCKSLAQETE